MHNKTQNSTAIFQLKFYSNSAFTLRLLIKMQSSKEKIVEFDDLSSQ